MCDYSLMGVPNRLANEGEDLVVHRFGTGSIGLIPSPVPTAMSRARKNARRNIWTAIRDYFQDPEPQQAVAVCIPPGARLLVRDIPEDLQQRYNIGPAQEVTFTQISAAPNEHRDAIRLTNGTEVLLQRLHEGQRVRVLQMCLSEEPIAATPRMAGVR